MNVITYALLCYGLTAVISLAVVAVVLVINSVMSKSDNGNGQS